MTNTTATTEPWDEEDFTPTQNLILEVLQARLRLGERVWTFAPTLKKQIEFLTAKGLINHKHGAGGGILVFPATETFRASLIASPYKIPLLENYISKEEIAKNYIHKSDVPVVLEVVTASTKKHKDKKSKNKKLKKKKSKKNKK
jgi:hypothetical protein